VTFRKPNYLLLFILIAGAVLRFYGFPNIPFMYDEVSAWARTGFTNFRELIDRGVKGDGHPAGIQVFLNYWRMFFGDSEATFKFPFLVVGLLCIWLVYRIGKFWFNATVGLITAAFIATLQYTVMYSQIARPYISGLFFSLMMVWCWTNYLFNPAKKNEKLQLLGYIIFSSLCCYNHYFSFLFALIVGVTGLFFVEKENRKEYVIAGMVIALLFIPHINITTYQLEIGGVGGWLAQPTPQFLADYLDYVFEFSLFVKGMVIVLIILSLIFYNREIGAKQKFRIIALAWFLFPILVGYFYSVTRNAVLQYSVLIFSFPYLLLFLFSLFRKLRPLYNFLLVITAMVFCIYSLVFERIHYDLFYRQPVEQLVKNSIEASVEIGSDNRTVLINEPKKYAGYYLRKYHTNLRMDYWAEKNFQSYIEFRKYLESQSSDYFIAGNVPLDYLMLVKNFYPYRIKNEKGFTYEFNCFSKSGPSVIDDKIFKDSLNIEGPDANWKFDANKRSRDSLSNHFGYHMDFADEYGPAFSILLKPLLTNGYNVLNVSMHVEKVKPGNQASLVVSIEEDGKSMFWQEKPFYLFMDSTESSGTIFYSMSVRDLGFTISDKQTLNVYTWNKKKDTFDINEMNIDIEEGNPWIYGLIEKVPHKRIF